MKTIVKMQFGSHVYGTNLPSSDIDYKVVHVPAMRDIILQRCPGSIVQHTKEDKHSKNTQDDIDIESFSLQKYLTLLLEGQTVSLDMLFTPEQWFVDGEFLEVWRHIKANKDKLLHSGSASFVGYCRTQANKYGIKGSRVAAAKLVQDTLEKLIETYGKKTKLSEVWNEILAITELNNEHIKIVEDVTKNNTVIRMLEVCNRKVQETAHLDMGYSMAKRIYDEYGHRARQAEVNEGIDWKAVMHAVRVCGEAEELLTTGNITFLRPNAEYLLKVRKAEIPFDVISKVLDEGMIRVAEASRNSSLPKQGDQKWCEELVFSTYLASICS